MALLAILAASFVHETGTQARIARNEYDRARARALADSGVSLAVLDLLSGPAARLPLDGSPRDVDLDGGTIRLRLQDEAGKIDLNDSPLDLVANLLRQMADEDEGTDFDAALADWKRRRLARWRQPDGAPANVARGPFLAIEDLREVAGVTQALYERVSPFVTVWSRSSRIDPFSAPRAVLLSLPGADMRAVDAYLAARGGAGSAVGLPGLAGYFSRENARQCITIAAEARASEALFVRQATISLVVAGSQRFRFVAWGEGGAPAISDR
ncbi:MAG TPA: hypothetical protein VFA12_17895 [Stellaceae bacterium]|nr:hypothetical protein [Stellaceae bacterium]